MSSDRSLKGLLARPITRRRLAKGTVAAGAAAAVLSVLSSCGDGDRGSSDPIDDTTEVTDITAEDSGFSFKDELSLKDAGSWSLPLGSVLCVGEGDWKPLVSANAASGAMATAGAFSVKAGEAVTLLKDSHAGGNYVIYEVRCSSDVFAWTELDLVTRDWKLFAASFDGSSLGDAVTLWEAGSDYDPAPLAVSGRKVVWLVMPSLTGSKTSENSSCYVWERGGSSAAEVVRSPGRFACPPSISQGTVTLVPRVRASEGQFYGITAYSLSDNLKSPVDQLVLPKSVKPFYATRVGDRFAWSIEANYGTGGSLGKMGTFIGGSQGPFVMIPREPAADVTGHNGLFVVKSRASYFVIDLDDKAYFSLAASNRCVDYGEYPATSGDSSTLVTFATVKNAETGYPDSVAVRAFSLDGTVRAEDKEKEESDDGEQAGDSKDSAASTAPATTTPAATTSPSTASRTNG